MMTAAPLKDRERPTIFIATALVLLAVLGLWAASLIATAVEPRTATARELMVSALYYLPFVLLPVAAYCLRHRGLSEGLRLNPLPVLPTLTVAFLALMCVYAASAVDGLWIALLNALGLHEPDVTVAAANSAGLTVQIIGSAAIPAVCEELLFRGVAFSAFERRGTWAGLWMSSALFALTHGNLFGLPAYLLVGAVAAFVVYALDSLYAGMLFHTVYNTAILVILYTLSDQAEARAEAGASVDYLSAALDLAVVGLLIGATLWTLDLRRRAAGIAPVPRDRAPLAKRERVMLILLLVVLAASTVVVQVLTEAGL